MLTQVDQSRYTIILTIAMNSEVGKWPKQASRGCQKLAMHNPTELVYSAVVSLLVCIHGATDPWL